MHVFKHVSYIIMYLIYIKLLGNNEVKEIVQVLKRLLY